LALFIDGHWGRKAKEVPAVKYKRLIWTLAVLGALVLPATAFGRPHTAHPPGSMSDPQGNLPGRFDGLGRSYFPRIYGGVVEVDHMRHLDVYLTRQSRSAEDSFRMRTPIRGDLTFRRTSHSASYLQAVQAQLSSRASALARRGIWLAVWWPKIQSGLEQVGVENLTLGKADTIRRMFGARSVHVFNVPPGNMPVLSAGRAYDQPPWKGGDYLANADFSLGCSSSFGVKIKGQNRLLSAAHCYGSWTKVVNFNVDGGGSNRYIGVVRQRNSRSGQADAEAIAANSADRIYTRSVYSTHLVAINGVTGNPVGSYVNNDGAYSGQTSLLRVVAGGFCYHPTGHRIFCNGVEAESSFARVANEAGDSGGPIIRVVSGRTYAAGIDSASIGGEGVHCKYNKASWCSANVVYANIDQSLAQLHAVMKTG
jgi:hypothetical protein